MQTNDRKAIPGACEDDAFPSAAALEALESIPVNPSGNATFGGVLAARFGRRGLLKAALTTAAAAALLGPEALLAPAPAAATTAEGSFDFAEVPHGVDETHHVAAGHDAEILIRWGDPLLPGAPAFDPMKQTADSQRMQFGYNNDFIGYVGLPLGSNDPEHGLLCVNHEYTNREVMFPGLGADAKQALAKMTAELCEVEKAAHGLSVVEVRRQDGKWAVVKDSRYARRIDAGSTAFTISGPAAGDARLRTKADPEGRRVIGTLNNCAGGITPWGTYLAAEENINGYFMGALPEGSPEAANYKRMGIPGNGYAWGRFDERFDLSKEPNEANRFGWVVEVDPLDPASTPHKRTALGRFKHEGAESVLNKDGRVVIYTGDDQQFEYVYRFVTKGRFDPNNRAANMNLLDEGTLSVARFDADGGLAWLPLVFGQGPLTEANGFKSQADVLIDARRAGDLLGATKMDRPEDIEPNPKTGKVYVNLTGNAKRTAEQVDGPNPRAKNDWGQVVELTAPDADHAADRFTWSVLVRCGDPKAADVGASFNPATTENGWFTWPDNCAVDPKGRLWISTDQGSSWVKSGTADGVWALETDGPLRGTGRMFFRVPVGAEMCGPRFAPDGKTLFVAVQHPACDGVKSYKPFGRASTFEDPATRWPDFKPDMPVRPSVVVITRRDGGVIGG